MYAWHLSYPANADFSQLSIHLSRNLSPTCKKKLNCNFLFGTLTIK